MSHRLRVTVAVCALLALGVATAQADWFEGFESYPAGGGVHGLGGWEGWNGDPAFDALVWDFEAFTGSQSLAVSGNADIVQMFSGYTSGVWRLVTWMYIPTDFTGTTYFIVLNTYQPNGAQNWSVQVLFENGQVVTTTIGGESVPWIMGEWVELRIDIDLTSNLQTFYYGDSVLYQESWTEGVSGGGALDIGAIDLFANAATPVYYDEMSLTPATVATENTSWSQVKSLFE